MHTKHTCDRKSGLAVKHTKQGFARGRRGLSYGRKGQEEAELAATDGGEWVLWQGGEEMRRGHRWLLAVCAQDRGRVPKPRRPRYGLDD